MKQRSFHPKGPSRLGPTCGELDLQAGIRGYLVRQWTSEECPCPCAVFSAQREATFSDSSPLLPASPRFSPLLPASPRFSPLLPASPRFSPLLPASPRFSPLLPASPRFSPSLFLSLSLSLSPSRSFSLFLSCFLSPSLSFSLFLSLSLSLYLLLLSGPTPNGTGRSVLALFS